MGLLATLLIRYADFSPFDFVNYFFLSLNTNALAYIHLNICISGSKRVGNIDSNIVNFFFYCYF